MQVFIYGAIIIKEKEDMNLRGSKLGEDIGGLEIGKGRSAKYLIFFLKQTPF